MLFLYLLFIYYNVGILVASLFAYESLSALLETGPSQSIISHQEVVSKLRYYVAYREPPGATRTTGEGSRLVATHW